MCRTVGAVSESTKVLRRVESVMNDLGVYGQEWAQQQAEILCVLKLK